MCVPRFAVLHRVSPPPSLPALRCRRCVKSVYVLFSLDADYVEVLGKTADSEIQFTHRVHRALVDGGVPRGGLGAISFKYAGRRTRPRACARR